MFDLPNAKRVKRDELLGSDSDREPTPEKDEDATRAALNAQLSRLLTLDPVPAAPAAPAPDGDADSNDGEQDGTADAPVEFEFRLFAGPSASAQKVVLAKQDLEASRDASAGGIIVPRPLAYYLRGAISDEEHARILQAAVSAQDVLAESRKRAWGLEKPWRVSRIVRSKPSKAIKHAGDGAAGEGEIRKRPSKQRRIALRKKEKVRKERHTKETQTKETKEQHLAEKKKRLNRERKLKRRQKERDKKAATKGETGGGSVNDKDMHSESDS